MPQKLRRLELTAGHAPARGQRGSAYNYNIKATRHQERRRVQQAEKVYERFVAGWNRSGPKVRTSAAKEERQ
jgi:transposase